MGFFFKSLEFIEEQGMGSKLWIFQDQFFRLILAEFYHLKIKERSKAQIWGAVLSFSIDLARAAQLKISFSDLKAVIGPEHYL